jgi:hypothetical protein
LGRKGIKMVKSCGEESINKRRWVGGGVGRRAKVTTPQTYIIFRSLTDHIMSSINRLIEERGREEGGNNE